MVKEKVKPGEVFMHFLNLHTVLLRFVMYTQLRRSTPRSLQNSAEIHLQFCIATRGVKEDEPSWPAAPVVPRVPQARQPLRKRSPLN